MRQALVKVRSYHLSKIWIKDKTQPAIYKLQCKLCTSSSCFKMVSASRCWFLTVHFQFSALCTVSAAVRFELPGCKPGASSHSVCSDQWVEPGTLYWMQTNCQAWILLCKLWEDGLSDSVPQSSYSLCLKSAGVQGLQCHVPRVSYPRWQGAACQQQQP